MINENGVEITYADELVGYGAALLDHHFDGPQWRKKINQSTLDISTVDLCILGQLFNGSYRDGLAALGLSVGYEHGFSECADATSEELQETWLNYINA